jgi:DNA polymerase-3 subunit delta
LLHILIGADDFSIHQALEAIKKSAGDPAALMPNTTLLEGSKVTPEQLRAACETVPFLADKRLVIVEGLLERFEPKKKNSRNGSKKSTRQPSSAEDYQIISAVVKNLPPFTELVLIGSGEIKSTNPLLHEIAPKARVSAFPLLNKREQLTSWIEKRVGAQSKAGISRKAADLMARLVGNDLWTMANEIDKLILYTGGRAVEEPDVKAVVSNVQEASVFEMVDAIIESRAALAQQLLQRLFQQGMNPAQVLVMLARQARIILQVKEMRFTGRTRADIKTRLGLSSEWVINKAWSQADKYSPSRIKEVYH